MVLHLTTKRKKEMATKGKRLTAEERIKLYKAKIEAIKKAEKEKNKKVKITKDSEGISELFALMDKVAKLHKLTMPQFVCEIARIRRTGLKIDN
jgi:hypothetical protein